MEKGGQAFLPTSLFESFDNPDLFCTFEKTKTIMSTLAARPPLSNIQMELLKLYAAGVPDDYLPEIKEMIARFLLEKARAEAGKVWEEKGYDAATAHAWIKGE